MKMPYATVVLRAILGIRGCLVSSPSVRTLWKPIQTLLLCLFFPVLLSAQSATDSLFEAVGQGNAEKVKVLLDQKADINARNANGRTPLMVGVMNGRKEVVKILLERGADANITAKTGDTAAQLALQLGDTDLVNLLKTAAVATDPQLAFFDSVQKTAIDGVDRALDKGADINTTVQNGQTALMMAAAKGNADGHALLKLLLLKGATVNAVDDDGKTAYDYADLPGKSTDTEAQRLLVERGAIIERYRAQQLNESLRKAVEKGDPEMVGALLAKKLDPNYVGNYHQNKTLLMKAAEDGQFEIVELLLKHGANPNRGMNGDPQLWLGITALFFAAENGNVKVAKALIDKGANVNVQQAKSGRTPLNLAAMSSRVEVVKLLLENGANPQATDFKGRTALSLADGEKRLEIQQLLTKAAAQYQSGEKRLPSDAANKK